MSYLLKALQVAGKYKLSKFEGFLLTAISEVHQTRNDIPKARLFLQKALAKSRAIGDDRAAAVCETNLGIILLTLHQPDSALIHSQRALTYYQSVQDSANSAVALKDIGAAYLQKKS